jgi:transcription termination/antitermination protein NusA
VMAELHGEKIDIVDYSENAAEFVGHALSPARVSQVRVLDEANRVAQVIVPDYQLSLAIGKEGQNVRLAARLTGWRIDIQPDNLAGDQASDRAGDGQHHRAGAVSRASGVVSNARPAPDKVAGAADAPAL